MGSECGATAPGPQSTSYTSSTHQGMSLWYQGTSHFGYIFPQIHIGYHSNGASWGMQSHGNPAFYCTLYDERGCGQAAYFDIWVL